MLDATYYTGCGGNVALNCSVCTAISEEKDYIDFKGIKLELVSHATDLEVTEFRMPGGASWTFAPETSINVVNLYLINGHMTWRTRNSEGILDFGGAMRISAMDDYVEVRASVDSQFILIRSTPIFPTYKAIFQSLNQFAFLLERRGIETPRHCAMMHDVAMLIAGRLGLTPSQRFALRIGVHFHDVGMLCLPDDILSFAGPLTKDEWELIQEHSRHGRDMLRDVGGGLLDEAARVVEQHHERHDGSGYPLGIRGDQIHIGARILAVLDSFVAMTRRRRFRECQSASRALTEIQSLSGIKYHEDVVGAFTSVFELFPGHFIDALD